MALISGWIVFYFAVFLPGPNTFFVASVGISGQKKQIWGAAVGTAIGSFTWCLLATTGISFLISNLMGWGFILLKILASLYMFYLAYQLVVSTLALKINLLNYQMREIFFTA